MKRRRSAWRFRFLRGRSNATTTSRAKVLVQATRPCFRRIGCGVEVLLALDASFLDELRVLGGLRLHVCAELRGRAGHGIDAEIRELFFDVRALHDFDQIRMKL